jgi:hypothetical protein
LVFPALSTIAMIYVGYKSVVPLPDPPARYAIFVFLGYTALGAALLAFLKSRGREDWLERARLATDDSQ